MHARRPRSLVLIAALQFIAVILVPPGLLAGMGPALWAAIVVLFGVLGISLYRQRAWARVASIFVQGMNIIVRLLVLLSNVMTEQGGVDYPLLITSFLAGALSAVIFTAIEKPEIQMAMQ